MLFTERHVSGSIVIDTGLQTWGNLRMMHYTQKYVSGIIAGENFSGCDQKLQRVNMSYKNM